MENGSVGRCDCGRNIYEKHRYSCDECFKSNEEKDVPNTISPLQTIELSESMKALVISFNRNYGKEEKGI